MAKIRGLLTARRKRPVGGRPNVGKPSEDARDRLDPEGKVEEQAHGPSACRIDGGIGLALPAFRADVGR